MRNATRTRCIAMDGGQAFDKVRHLDLAGLDRNNYDRAACESYFQTYKECKKREVGLVLRIVVFHACQAFAAANKQFCASASSHGSNGAAAGRIEARAAASRPHGRLVLLRQLLGLSSPASAAQRQPCSRLLAVRTQSILALGW